MTITYKAIQMIALQDQVSLTRVTVTGFIWRVGSSGVAEETQCGEMRVPEDVGVEVAGCAVALRDQAQQLPRSLGHLIVVDLHPCLTEDVEW